MKRVLVKSAVLVLIPALLIAGCTKQKPGVREATTTPGATAVASGVTVTIPTAQVGGELLPTLTPTPKMTTISTQPTAAATRDFGELTGAQTTPTAVITVTSAPLSTPVPVLTPLPVTTPPPVATQLPAATPLPAVPEPSTGQYAPGGLTYVVRWGDTLSSISYQFGVTVQAIKSANGLSSDMIVVGQQLIIPGVAGGPSPGPGGGTTVHIVQPGENLFRIALRYNTTVEAIAQASGIANPWFIYVGQQLTIPVGGGGGGIAPPSTTHVVQPGDTLYLIAARFNTTVQALMVANNLSNPNLIYVGQLLKIP
jgi:LysM repeat protein